MPGFLLSRFLPITRLSRPNPKSSSAEIEIPPEGTPSHSTTHRGLHAASLAAAQPHAGIPGALGKMPHKITAAATPAPSARFGTEALPECKPARSQVQVLVRFTHHCSRTGGEKRTHALFFVTTFPSWRAPTQRVIANRPLPSFTAQTLLD